MWLVAVRAPILVSAFAQNVGREDEAVVSGIAAAQVKVVAALRCLLPQAFERRGREVESSEGHAGSLIRCPAKFKSFDRHCNFGEKKSLGILHHKKIWLSRLRRENDVIDSVP